MAEFSIIERMLLCCQLGQTVQPLSPKEFNRLSEELRLYPQIDMDALGYSPRICQRVQALLEREEALWAYVRAVPEIQPIWPGHALYPLRLELLQEEMPPVLFCKGDPDLLLGEHISVVGSREPAEANAAFARALGERIAEEGFTLVSGNARGIDTIAQEACLAAGGKVVAFVPDMLKKYPERKNVLYLSDEGYDRFFTAQRALRRNIYIHGLGKLCFVAQCAKTAGGTWQGSADNLRHGRSPLYLYSDGTAGADALLRLGAKPLYAAPDNLRVLL